MSDSLPDDQSSASREDESGSEFVSHLVRYRHSLYAFIAKQVVQPADTEDLFQKTSLVLWSKRNQFDPQGSFFHWACGIAMNEVRNYRRTRGRNRLHFDSELSELLAAESVSEQGLTQARLDALNKCVKKLSTQQQKILRRCYDGSATVSDVAHTLGCSRDALYKQLARLRQRLSECINGRITVEELP